MKYSCYYIIHLGCLMGFTMHFYITFGTNLLTQSPVPVPVFPLFQCFEEKEYQTESKRNEINWRSYFWNESYRMDLDPTSEDTGGAHEGGGRAPLRRGSLVSFLTCTPSLSGSFPSKNNFSRRFHSVSTPFDIPFLRNTETRGKKQELTLGSGSIG